MFAITFDMVIADLNEYYGKPYNNAYYEIKSILKKYDFYNIQGSVYMTKRDDMVTVHRAIDALKKIEWFRKSVRDVRAFRVEQWSDYTNFVRNE